MGRPRARTVVLLSALFLPVTAMAQTNGDGRRTIGGLPANLGRAAVGTVHEDTLAPILIGGGATGLAFLFDEQVPDRLSAPDRRFGRWLESVGRPWMSGAATFGLLVGSRYSDSPRFRAVSYDLFNAQVVNWVYTTILKRATRRGRPDGLDRWSFPSGHASNAFALAAVIEGHYGWRGGIPAYAVASAMGGARLQRNKHYLSDVVGGAVVGYVVGRTVVRTNSAPLTNDGPVAVTIVPLINGDTRAIRVSIVF